MSDLSYNVATMQLTGSLNGFKINAIAYSGGRGGSKVAGATNMVLANNPFLTHVKLNDGNKDSIGGALPLGTYTLQLHEKNKNWIRLIPDSGNQMWGRAGFAIHGRGDRGSDGCIVPSDFSVVQQIYNAVKTRMIDKAPPYILKVEAIGDLTYYEGIC